MIETIELLPCPHCGHPAVLRAKPGEGVIECTACPARMSSVVFSDAMLAGYWNRRTPPATAASDEGTWGCNECEGRGVVEIYESEEVWGMDRDVYKGSELCRCVRSLLAATAASDEGDSPLQQGGRERLRDELIAALREVEDMLSCTPETPWRGCKGQKYSNDMHYIGHTMEVLTFIDKTFVRLHLRARAAREGGE